MIIKEFLPIKDCDGFFVNEQGIVLSNQQGTILKQLRPQINAAGYHTIKFIDNNGIRKHHLVHRLVAQTFLPNPNQLTDVNHLDGKTLNNDVSNLEWCTRSDNLFHFYKENTKTVKTKCSLFVDGIAVGVFESIRKACNHINNYYEPCNINSISNQLRIGIKPYKGRYSIERI